MCIDFLPRFGGTSKEFAKGTGQGKITVVQMILFPTLVIFFQGMEILLARHSKLFSRHENKFFRHKNKFSRHEKKTGNNIVTCVTFGFPRKLVCFI